MDLPIHWFCYPPRLLLLLSGHHFEDILFASPSLMTLNHRAAQVALVVKNPPANEGDLEDMGSIPGSGRSPGVGNAAHFNIIAWKNPLDRGAWWVTSHRVSKSWT